MSFDPVGRGRERGHLDATAAHASGLFTYQEPRFLEHAEVLQEGRERNPVWAMELHYRSFSARQLLHHLPADRIGQGCEDAIE